MKTRALIIASVALLVAIALFAIVARTRQNSGVHSPNYGSFVDAFYTGVVALQVGDETHGDTLLVRATQLMPNEPAAWADLGLYYLRAGDFSKADADLKHALAMAPNNASIESLVGLFAQKQGNFDDAVRHYSHAHALAATDPLVSYALIDALEQQGASSPAQISDQLKGLLAIVPRNLFVKLKFAEQLAKQGDTQQLRPILTELESQWGNWSQQSRSDLKSAADSLSRGDTRSMVPILVGISNELVSNPQYRSDKVKVDPPQDRPGVPLEHFIVLPSPSPSPAPMDRSTRLIETAIDPNIKCSRVFSADFDPQVPEDVHSVFQSIASKPEGPLSTLVVHGEQLSILGGTGPKQTLPFVPNAEHGDVPAGCIAVADLDYSFRPDLVTAGRDGLHIYRQDARGHFSDVSQTTNLPSAILKQNFSGVWAADVDSDGDLDLIVAPVGKPVFVLRNNGDGTFTPIHPFPSAPSSVIGFCWASLKGDGAPDASFVTTTGDLLVYANLRSGQFQRVNSPTTDKVAAITAGDPDQTGTLGLTAFSAMGSITQYAWGNNVQSPQWTATDLVKVGPTTAFGTSNVIWEDLDNNGGLDLIETDNSGSHIWLADRHNHLQATAIASSYTNLCPAISDNAARVNFVGTTLPGVGVSLTNSGGVHYSWQTIRPRANFKERTPGTHPAGGERINPFGIGGEIEIRAGLLYNKLSITGPTVHVGLGQNAQANYIRILWPNGDSQSQGEFDLPADQVDVAFQRLKASCPWLFAWNGTRMQMVTDCIWRSPLGLKINAQATAGIVQTQDWVKIRGDQLTPRNGYYDLRICAELWETHFFDHLALMTVDHPRNTDVFVDERFSIPPPPLSVTPMSIPVPVKNAKDDLGNDVTALISKIDGKYVGTFGHGQYQGITRDHYLQGEIGSDAPRHGPLWLVANGWIHPTDSSINVAIAQGNHSPPQGLRLEVANGKGGWRVARAGLGFPEGKIKTILINLDGVFVPGAPRIFRLRTNLEIYWDYVGYAVGKPQTRMVETRLQASSAILRYRGFSQTTQVDDSSPELPDYYKLAATGQKWRDLEGYYTRYGDVRPLIRATDDRYVIMDAGDELAMKFKAQPPPPVGWTRDYVLIGDGWVKDGDFNTDYSRTVIPLPQHAVTNYTIKPTDLEDDPVYRAHKSDWVTYQTRFVAPEQFRTALLPVLH